MLKGSNRASRKVGQHDERPCDGENNLFVIHVGSGEIKFGGAIFFRFF
jgi:hypothetical protein